MKKGGDRWKGWTDLHDLVIDYLSWAGMEGDRASQKEKLGASGGGGGGLPLDCGIPTLSVFISLSLDSALTGAGCQ